MKKILITGAAGFIGFHLACKLKARGDFCIGIDNFNAYYDPFWKKERAFFLNELGIDILPIDIGERGKIETLIESHQITHVVHLAAQAGVRHSIDHPDDYVHSNLIGFVALLEALKRFPQIKFIFASSSSVYGLNKKIPFRESDQTDLSTNLYSATKKANETIAHAYHHLYGLSMTALRYFTVYGPWGRPDMAYFRFTEKIVNQEPIPLFNSGRMKRDFTYIDDIVQGTIAAIDLGASWEIFNLGNNRPIELLYFVELLEKALGKKAIKRFLPMQKGEVIETAADIEKSQKILKFTPITPIEEGIARFTNWYFAKYNERLLGKPRSHSAR